MTIRLPLILSLGLSVALVLPAGAAPSPRAPVSSTGVLAGADGTTTYVSTVTLPDGSSAQVAGSAPGSLHFTSSDQRDASGNLIGQTASVLVTSGSSDKATPAGKVTRYSMHQQYLAIGLTDAQAEDWIVGFGGTRDDNAAKYGVDPLTDRGNLPPATGAAPAVAAAP